MEPPDLLEKYLFITPPPPRGNELAKIMGDLSIEAEAAVINKDFPAAERAVRAIEAHLPELISMLTNQVLAGMRNKIENS